MVEEASGLWLEKAARLFGGGEGGERKCRGNHERHARRGNDGETTAIVGF